MGWLKRLFGGSQTKALPSSWTPASQRFHRVQCWGPTPDSVEVVGESWRGDAFQWLFAQEPAFYTEGGHEESGSASLVPDPQNPHDPNAVAVYIRDHHVGYLPRDVAAEWHEPLTAPGGGHGTLMTQVRAWARMDGEQVRARVTVRLPEHPDHIRPANSHPEGNVAHLPPGNRSQVTKEENHQEHLQQLLDAHGPSAAYAAVLRPAARPGPKGTTVTAVEVLIDGQLVGELTGTTSAHYRPALEQAAQAGQTVVARVSLSIGERKIEAHLDARKGALATPPQEHGSDEGE